MTPAILEVEPLDEYVLRIFYENGERRVLDLKPWINNAVLKKLKDPALFAKAKISFDTIEWPNGLDLDPEFVYSHAIEE